MATPPVFKFARETYSVRIENIADCATRHDIMELFNNLVGDIRKCDEHFDKGSRSIELTFHSRDACKKALCMSGYTVSGVPLSVTALSPLNCINQSNNAKSADTRRNLYVLGLPFDLTKPEFASLFSRYGTVSHCVVLATVDNASRRRGFVVMSNHAEAKAAMNALSRMEVKGHIIDVSWAVVQRSQGFLDGGDRAMVLASRPASASSMHESDTSECDTGYSSPAISSSASSVSHQDFSTPLACIPPPPTCLMVSNLPTMLFAQTVDLQPLFCPYGEVKKIDILDPSYATVPNETLSVMVEYASPLSTQEAKQMLHGQNYAGFTVKVELAPSASAPCDSGSSSISVSPRLSLDRSDSNLNPLAAPFTVKNGLTPTHGLSTPPALARLSYFDGAHHDYTPRALPNGRFAYSGCPTPSAIPDLSSFANGAPYDYRVISRPNSGASSPILRPPPRNKWHNSLPNVHHAALARPHHPPFPEPAMYAPEPLLQSNAVL